MEMCRRAPRCARNADLLAGARGRSRWLVAGGVGFIHETFDVRRCSRRMVKVDSTLGHVRMRRRIRLSVGVEDVNDRISDLLASLP
jgi:hypothetical protein